MAGTRIGGLKAKKANLANDPDFYAKIGSKGGSSISKYPKGFAAMSAEKVSAAGRKGGRISKRGKAKANE